MMTRNKAFNASSYIFSASEGVLLDTNVLLFLHPPAAQPTPYHGRSYSAVLKKLIQAGAKPLAESLILSEYLNRYIRLEYNVTWKHIQPDYKTFRQSPDYTPIAQNAIAEIRTILGYATIRDTAAELLDIASILSEVETGSLDFNDGVILDLCRIRGWSLLTHDLDMQVGGVNVVTANAKLLSACP